MSNEPEVMDAQIVRVDSRPLAMTREQKDLLKRTICNELTDDQFMLFMAICDRRGLDPFAKQVYPVLRNANEGDRWVKKMVIQTGIDGFRAIAERTRQMDGQDGPYWCGDDGKWLDVWLNAAPPRAAKVVVHRKGASHGFVGVALFDSYAQKDGKGQLTKFWQQMASEMLAKCAEALALRKAFPEDLSGLYTHDEMMQADNGNGDAGASSPSKPKPPSPGDDLKAQARKASGKNELTEAIKQGMNAVEVNEHGQEKAKPERVAELKRLWAVRTSSLKPDTEQNTLAKLEVKKWEDASVEDVEKLIDWLNGKKPAKAATAA